MYVASNRHGDFVHRRLTSLLELVRPNQKADRSLLLLLYAFRFMSPHIFLSNTAPVVVSLVYKNHGLLYII